LLKYKRDQGTSGDRGSGFWKPMATDGVFFTHFLHFMLRNAVDKSPVFCYNVNVNRESQNSKIPKKEAVPAREQKAT